MQRRRLDGSMAGWLGGGMAGWRDGKKLEVLTVETEREGREFWRMISTRLLHCAALSACAIAGTIAVAPPVGARTPFLTEFNTLYGTSGTRLDSCGTCHFDFDGGGARNPFGIAWEDAEFDFVAIESDDSDGDGFTNFIEIGMLFMPGLTCNNLGLTSNEPFDLANYVDPANSGCGAAAPDIDVVPLALDFGLVDVNVASTLTVMVSNLGDADLTVTDMVISGSMDFGFGAGFPTTPLLLEPSQSIDVPVEYLPTDVGSDGGMLSIHSDDPDELNVVVSLAGIGAPVATPTPTAT
ncbi:MAG TPA: choice-of-anchor D domain-containing protein, partial [Myxococcota bacterium]|nr:choice-of-anchor D domain-containing protein [Myxococcota bacterium]